MVVETPKLCPGRDTPSLLDIWNVIRQQSTMDTVFGKLGTYLANYVAGLHVRVARENNERRRFHQSG